jgi:hypothetical protein
MQKGDPIPQDRICLQLRIEKSSERRKLERISESRYGATIGPSPIKRAVPDGSDFASREQDGKPLVQIGAHIK